MYYINPTLYQNKYRIKSIRIPGWDYSQNGWYFITICTKGRQCCLGKIKNNQIKLSINGMIVKNAWYNLPKHYGNCQLDYFIIMPNHIHGIIVINNNINHAHTGVVETGFKPVSTLNQRHTLSEIVRGFKTFSAKRINQQQHTPGQPFWQPRFYDHIIRNNHDLYRIQQYIKNNPLMWMRDRNRG